MKEETELIVLKFLEQYDPETNSAEILAGRMASIISDEGYDREICWHALRRKALKINEEKIIQCMDSGAIIKKGLLLIEKEELFKAFLK